MERDIVLPTSEKFDSGERVSIKEGPFKDFYGIFEGTYPVENEPRYFWKSSISDLK
jgi:transcription antitermination factor NusG